MNAMPTPSTAVAVVCDKPGAAALREVSLAQLGDDDVLIRTGMSGISTGTDKWVMSGRFEWGGFRFPLVPGYQRVGVVAAVGEAVRSVQVDDVVFATSSRDFSDATAGWGAHAQWAVSPEQEVFLAHGVPPITGSLAVSAQVGVNAASRLTKPQEQRVLVVGDGIIGVSSALAARERGCAVLLAGHHDQRLQRVQASSSEITIVNTHHDWQGIVTQWGPTAVIDTVQNSDMTNAYVPMLPCTWNADEALNPRMGLGEIVFAGHSPDGVTTWADMALLQKFEVDVHFVSGWTRARMEDTLDLMRLGRLNLDPLVQTVSAESADCAPLLKDVMAGSLASVAACIDWGSP